MPRKLRITEPAFYHVISRGNLKDDIFDEPCDYDFFLSLLFKVKKDFDLTIHAFCLMTNHYHLLIETKQTNLSLAIKYLNFNYARYFNKRYKRVGHLWQGRFFSSYLYDDLQAFDVAKYIERNPFVASMVSTISSYSYQSFYVWKNRTFFFKLLENSIIFDMTIDEYEVFINSRFKEDVYSLIYKTPTFVKKNGKFKILYKRLKTFFNDDVSISRDNNIKKAYDYGYTKVDIASYLNLSTSLISKVIKINVV